jgi:hypothetical protein
MYLESDKRSFRGLALLLFGDILVVIPKGCCDCSWKSNREWQFGWIAG